MNLLSTVHSRTHRQTLFALSLVFLVLGSATAAEDLQIAVQSTRGERSKDSSSATTRITVNNTQLVWEQTGSGRRGRWKTPAHRKEFQLSAHEKSKLLEVIKANDLLRTESLQLPQQPPVFYFNLSLDLAAGAQRGAIKLSGPRSATEAGNHALYRKSMILVKELYRIIGTHDETIRFDDPLQQQR